MLLNTDQAGTGDRIALGGMPIAVARHTLTQIPTSLLPREAGLTVLTGSSSVADRTRALLDERGAPEVHVLQTGGAHADVVDADFVLRFVVIRLDQNKLDVLQKNHELFARWRHVAEFLHAPRGLESETKQNSVKVFSIS